jgi:GT2 family glycosyltransferase
LTQDRHENGSQGGAAPSPSDPENPERAALLAECAQYRTELADLVAELRRAENAVGDWKREADTIRDLLHQSYASQQRLAEGYEARLAAIYQSASWRFARPVRLVARLRDRLRGAGRPPVSTALDALEQPAAPVPEAPHKPMPKPAPEDVTTVYRRWITEVEAARRSPQAASSSTEGPLISLIVPVYRVPASVLVELVQSVLRQSYGRWELCIAHAEPEDALARAYLADLARRDARIRVRLLSENKGISANSNRALELAQGEFLALLDHDDTLAPTALQEVVEVLRAEPEIDFVYSDRDQLSVSGDRDRPLFKPDWSPDLMLSANYLTHFNVIRTDLVRAVGGWRSETDGAQDWDLFLRVIHRINGRIRHIPRILYHWRRLPTSAAARGLAAKPYALEAQRRAVQDDLAARGLPWTVETRSDRRLQIRWDAAFQPTVSVVLASSEPQEACMAAAEALAAMTADGPFEILVPGEAADRQGRRLRVVALPSGLTPLEQMDHLVAQCPEGVIVLVDAALRPADSSWLREMVGPLQDPDIGIVGACLLDAETGLLRHAGLVQTPDGRVEAPYQGKPEFHDGLLGRADWYRNWSAVSGACLSIRSGSWRRCGGLTRAAGQGRPDVDLCSRVRAAENRRVLYNPFARLVQHRPAVLERAPKGSCGAAGGTRARPAFHDPYLNPHLDVVDGVVRLAGLPSS